MFQVFDLVFVLFSLVLPHVAAMCVNVFGLSRPGRTGQCGTGQWPRPSVLASSPGAMTGGFRRIRTASSASWRGGGVGDER